MHKITTNHLILIITILSFLDMVSTFVAFNNDNIKMNFEEKQLIVRELLYIEPLSIFIFPFYIMLFALIFKQFSGYFGLIEQYKTLLLIGCLMIINATLNNFMIVIKYG